MELKTNTSNYYTLNEEDIKRVRDIIDKKIKIDEEEDAIHGDKKRKIIVECPFKNVKQNLGLKKFFYFFTRGLQNMKT